MRNLLAAIAVGALCLIPLGAQAQSIRTFTINFNDVAPGTAVNTTYQAATGATFELVNNPALGQVIADNPGFPANPDPALNALSGVDGPVRYFDAFSAFIRSFSFDVVVDPAGFGQTNALVSFLGSNGSVVSTLSIDQTVAGTYTYTAPSDAVTFGVVLPGDAFYDNVTATVVAAPEPATLGLLAGGLLVGGIRARRRK